MCTAALNYYRHYNTENNLMFLGSAPCVPNYFLVARVKTVHVSYHMCNNVKHAYVFMSII